MQLYLSDTIRQRVLYQHNLKIPSSLVGKRLNIHTGKRIMSLLIKDSFVGLPLYSLFLTKKMGGQIHKEKTKATGKKGK